MKKKILILAVVLFGFGLQQANAQSEEGVVINGVRWATRNVDNPGTFAARRESAGKFYQWNRNRAWATTGKTVVGWNSSTPTGNMWEKANDPSPAGWRVPTLEEVKTLLDESKVKSEWTNINGIKGRKFTDKSTGSSIFLPAANERDANDNGNLVYGGVYGSYGELGYYWTNTQAENYSSNQAENDIRAQSWYFSQSYTTTGALLRANGRNIRPVAETAAPQTASTTQTTKPATQTSSNTSSTNAQTTTTTTQTSDTEMYEYKEAIKAFENKDYAKCKEWFLKAVNKGNSEAMYNIGNLYEKDKDYAKAKEWYLKAAEKGIAEAMTSLGVFYFEGQGVKQDYLEAYAWSKKAADKGDAEAMANIGYMYREGKGINQDDNKAIEWYTKAVQNGYEDAMTDLGWIYIRKGAVQDHKKAFEWYSKAADKGIPLAMYQLGWLYAYGGIERDYQKSRKWFTKAAENGYEEAKKQIVEIDKLIAQSNTTQTTKPATQTSSSTTSTTDKSAELVGTKWSYEDYDVGDLYNEGAVYERKGLEFLSNNKVKVWEEIRKQSDDDIFGLGFYEPTGKYSYKTYTFTFDGKNGTINNRESFLIEGNKLVYNRETYNKVSRFKKIK